jgi:hypothetical protein
MVPLAATAVRRAGRVVGRAAVLVQENFASIGVRTTIEKIPGAN